VRTYRSLCPFSAEGSGCPLHRHPRADSGSFDPDTRPVPAPAPEPAPRIRRSSAAPSPGCYAYTSRGRCASACPVSAGPKW
jgi:hypothetical protein